jgi:hypothetical protein
MATEHENRQEEAIRHLAEAVKALAENEIHGATTLPAGPGATKALKLAEHVLALVAVDETETDGAA